VKFAIAWGSLAVRKATKAAAAASEFLQVIKREGAVLPIEEGRICGAKQVQPSFDSGKSQSRGQFPDLSS